MPSDPNVTIRARIAFIFLAMFMIALSAGAYFIGDLAKSRDSIAAREAARDSRRFVQDPAADIHGRPTKRDRRQMDRYGR